MSAFWIKWLIYGVLAALVVGTATLWVRDYTDAQAAQEARKALCKAQQLRTCTDEAIMQAQAADTARIDALEEAQAANDAALSELREVAAATQAALNAQVEREAASAKRLQALNASMRELREKASADTVRWLDEPVPPDVLKQLDEVLK